MKKSLYKIVIFVLHIITITLLLAICLHFGIIRLGFIKISKETFIKIFDNDYFINIFCTVFTAIALYIIQIQYSKHKLKNDYRFNEIINDVYNGIERTYKLFEKSKPIREEIEEIKENSDADFHARWKDEALKYLSFYKNNKVDFEICNMSLTYHNNWLLIESVQTVFFINLNFKLLNIVNNIKNRKPNLEEEYPKIKELFDSYENNNDDKTLIQLGHEIRRFLVDIDFMAKYWFSLLNYLGYDPFPIKMYIELFKNEYPEYSDITEFFKLPISQQNKISRKIQKKVSKLYFKHRITNFFS